MWQHVHVNEWTNLFSIDVTWWMLLQIEREEENKPEGGTEWGMGGRGRKSGASATHGAMEAVRRVDKRLVKVVEQNVYVDDYYGGGEEVQEVVDEFVDVRDAMKLSSLHLGKVMSNSKEILAKFPDKEKAPKFRDIYAKDSQSLPSTNALGLHWDCEKDIFCFSTRVTAKTPKNVSEVLSQLASTYNPLQTVGPYFMMESCCCSSSGPTSTTGRNC
jgi:hypothetical protein